MNKEEYMKNLYLFNEDQIEAVEVAIDFYLDKKFYGGQNFVIDIDSIFYSESADSDDFNKTMSYVIKILCDNFNLDKDIFPSFYRFIDEGLPNDDDLYNDPDIDLEKMSDSDRESYQEDHKDKLSDELHSLGKEFEKFFNTLEKFCLQKKENLNINEYIKRKKNKHLSL